MSRSLLDEHRQHPTKETTRQLIAALQGEAVAVLRRHPAKSLPDWVSFSQLKDIVQDALRTAVENLPASIDYNEIADHVRDEIKAAVSYAIRPEPGDHLRRRGHAVRRGFRRPASDAHSVDAVDGLDDEIGDYRDKIQDELAAMFKVANTQKRKTLIGLIEVGAPLNRIRAETGLRGPDIIRELMGLRVKAKQ